MFATKPTFCCSAVGLTMAQSVGPNRRSPPGNRHSDLGLRASVPRRGSRCGARRCGRRAGVNPQITYHVILCRNGRAVIGKETKPPSDGPRHIGQEFADRTIFLIHQNLDSAERWTLAAQTSDYVGIRRAGHRRRLRARCIWRRKARCAVPRMLRWPTCLRTSSGMRPKAEAARSARPSIAIATSAARRFACWPSMTQLRASALRPNAAGNSSSERS